MLDGLYSAAAGMAAQELQLDALSNDLANLSTTGYKAERVAFSDLLYSNVDEAGTATTVGAGASAQLDGRVESQGALRETGNPLDLAIEGDGFFAVTGPAGQTLLTRNGAFSVDASGTLVDGRGDRLSPAIKLPAGVLPEDLSIAPDGTVMAGTRKLGQIKLVTVRAPGHMTPEGDSLFAPTSASGPIEGAGGRIRQGALEDSNVDVGRDMATMMRTQRSFQLASTAIQTESQMMAIANQLRA